MKRPVTSLCRRPGKKDRLRGSLSPMREQFPPTGTLCGGQAELPGKSRPDEGAKTTTGRGIGGLTPHGRVAGNGVSGAGKAPHWAHAGAEGTPGCKNSPRRSRRLCAGCAHVGMADMEVLVPGKHRTGCPPGQRAYPAQKQSPAEAGSCAQTAPMGERRAWGFWCREGAALSTRWSRGYARAQKQPRAGARTVRRLRPHGGAADIVCGVVSGKHHTGRTPGQGARPGAKQPPAGAGGCLNAGYGCYLPRAIRVIWMHRVGSTARPRIMPS